MSYIPPPGYVQPIMQPGVYQQPYVQPVMQQPGVVYQQPYVQPVMQPGVVYQQPYVQPVYGAAPIMYDPTSYYRYQARVNFANEINKGLNDLF